MYIGTIFWVLMILVLVFGVFVYWPIGPYYGPFGMTLLVWVLLALLGWKCFGPMVKG